MKRVFGRHLLASVGAVALGATILTGCGGSGKSPATGQSAGANQSSAAGSAGANQSTPPKSVTITVALASPSPPQALLNDFTAKTGIKVNWVNMGYPDLQTKITAAGAANTYFADATDVDWSRVGEFAKTKWFLPLDKYLDTGSLSKDMPQLAGFQVGGQTIGIPYDASFLVTTVNTDMFAKAGITTMPTTISAYTDDLKKIKAAGVVKYPLNMAFAAVEGLSTFWYQTTAAFGGTVLTDDYKPAFTDPNSAGYQALTWMVNAYKDGLVPPGNINLKGGQADSTVMAKGLAASTLTDFSGNVESTYDVPSASTVTGKVTYIPTPGLTGVAGNISNPDGIGIPKAAKNPEAAATFIEWFTSAANQAQFSGLNGPSGALPGYVYPSRLSALSQLGDKLGAATKVIAGLSSDTKPAFTAGPPPWYSEFSNAVYTNIHSTVAGQETVEKAVAQIADTVNRLRSSG
jgi:multiple sugar transport system substrate-binding protein